MSGQARVVCIGIATIDAVVAVERVPQAGERVAATNGTLAGGGVAATAAVTLARLGVPVAFVGRVADDAAGRWIRDDLAAEGVDVAGLALTGARSPVSAVLVHEAAGERSLAPYLGAPIGIEPSDDTISRCAAAAWVHVDQLGVDLVPALRAAGVATRVSLDGGVPVPGQSLDGIDLFAPTEAALLARYPSRQLDAALRAALDDGPSVVVATRGAAGSVAMERASDGSIRRHDAAAFGVDVRGGSTLGAGDVFHGALLAGLVEGRGLGEALARANACAALACCALDGRSAIPRPEELDAFLATAASPAAGPTTERRTADARA